MEEINIITDDIKQLVNERITKIRNDLNDQKDSIVKEVVSIDKKNITSDMIIEWGERLSKIDYQLKQVDDVKYKYGINEKEIEEREWNYYFNEGTKVTIDKDANPPGDNTESFHLYDLKSLVGKEGIVKKVGWDLHAFGRGTSYYMDVEFDGKIYTQISAVYLKEYE